MASEEKESWTKICDGPHGEVWLSAKCLKELAKLRQPELYAKAYANMTKRFCALPDLGDLSPSQFNPNEGRYTYDKKEVMLSTFKGGDLRIYGCVGSVKGCRAFFGTFATYKQKNNLDMDDARTAVKRLVEEYGSIEGAKL